MPRTTSPRTIRRFQSKMKRGIFDVRVIGQPDAVMLPVLRDARAALMQWAKNVRRKAQRTMRRSDSPKGGRKTPFVRTGRLKKNIVWDYNEAGMWAIVGPRRLNNTVSRGKAPSALEKGGSSRTVLPTRTPGLRRYVVRTIRPIPYMGPAAKKILPTIPNIWRSQGRLT